jgi:hypothetical protein
MLVLNHSLLNKECNLINLLKALVATVSMCSLHVIFLSKITQIFYTVYNRNIPFIHCERNLGGLIRREK